jgi:glycosidase
MFDGDPRRLELAYSLMFTFPGTPVMRYGDFSSASPDRLIRPIISSASTTTTLSSRATATAGSAHEATAPSGY